MEMVNRQIVLAELRAHPQNYNRHPAEQLGRLAVSLEKFGQVRSVVVWRMTLLAGHGVVAAARSLGWESIRADVLPDAYPEELALAYLVADNELSRGADPDMEQLAALLEQGRQYDDELLAAMGFSDDEYDRLLKEVSSGDQRGLADVEPDMGQAEALRQKWGVETGQLWQLGEHRLICGDCTDANVVAKVLGGDRPEMMVTDPPYGVEYDPAWRAEAGVNRNKGKMGTVRNDDRADWFEAWQLFDGDVAYVYHAGVNSAVVQDSLERAEFVIRAQIVWAKERMALSRGDYHWQHEPCWYAVRKERLGRRTDDRSQTTLWQIPTREDSGHGHGTQKPLECMARPIRNHEFSVIYEPFAGSGTTLIACEQLRRKCLAVELNPAYVAVALERWAMVTGKTPVRVD